LYHDFKELLSALNARQVKYLVVGGYAVSFHAQPRATRDLDILIKADAENGRAVFAALAQFGAPLEGLSSQDLIEPSSFHRMGMPPVMVDILPRISGVDFEEAWQRRVSVTIDDTLTAPFISREDLLAAKIAAGRPQDLADAAALGASLEHGGQPNPSTTAGAGRSDELLDAREKGREEWLKLRQKQLEGSRATAEEIRAQAREDWLKLREQQRIDSSAAVEQKPDKNLSRDTGRNESAKDREKGVDEDPDS
jgi:hypothetical protein